MKMGNTPPAHRDLLMVMVGCEAFAILLSLEPGRRSAFVASRLSIPQTYC